MNVQTIRYIAEDNIPLWEEPMRYSRLWAVDDSLAEAGCLYRVLAVRVDGSVQIVKLARLPENAA
jgi:hypothetical protein